jgi:enamine deaminase RidA (YjgF/YER057c/UK114 family)
VSLPNSIRNVIVGTTIEEQTEQVMDNLTAVLDEAARLPRNALVEVSLTAVQ